MRHSGPEYHERYLGWLPAEAFRDEFRVGTGEKVVEVARLRKLAQFVVEGFIELLGRIWRDRCTNARQHDMTQYLLHYCCSKLFTAALVHIALATA
jgi:hypothetical protein